MTKSQRSRLTRLLITVVSLALFATACGGGDVVTSEEASAATIAAETNEAALVLGGDLATTEMLDSRTGEIRSLSDVVTGDRAVLLWYWAPH